MTGAVRTRAPWFLWGVAMLLLAGILALSAVNDTFSVDAPFIPLAVTMILGYSTVGALLASRNPGNPIGWLMMTIGGAFVIGGFATEYVHYTYVTNPGSLPGGLFAAWVINWIYAVMMSCLPHLGLLFPTGRVPSPRWRWLVPSTIAFGACAVVGTILTFGLITDAPEGVDILNPTGVRGFPTALAGIGWIGLIAALAASIAAVIVRYRRSAGEERQQIRWLAYVVITAAVLVLVAATMAIVVGDSFGSTVAGQVFAFAGFALVGIGVPAAMGVAILKYRLYDLDLVIKKAVVFGILVVLLTVVGGIVLVLPGGALIGLPSENPGLVLLAGATLGLLLVPLYRLAKRIADRVVYGGRAKPYEVMTEFSDRAASAYSTEDVLPRMAQILGQGSGAASARVWLRVGSALRPVASWPEQDEGTSFPIAGDELPLLPGSESAFEVRHQGELLGALSVTMPASDPMNASKERLIRDLASQTGLVLRNVRLIEELRESRKRIVSAQDQRAKKLERDIHDGAQQQLVALSVKARLARGITEPDELRAMLTQIETELQTALEDLRDLARGIYPPLLADKGLATALEAQARRSPVPVSVDPDGVGRYAQEIESAVYFCTLEALNNVAKYADATAVRVTLTHEDGLLSFSVIDDGRGFDPASTGYGTGLQGMADRLEAIGGELRIESAPGRGTTVTGGVQAEADP
ncbi:MAG: sensor histidine kinase [Actinobacteria bacterium]|nr:sensor histidine kinase [Actinomycetota bacterium]